VPSRLADRSLDRRTGLRGALANTALFLANAWHELFRRSENADHLRRNVDLLPRAIEELLRLAGPSRAVFRIATSDLSIGEATIRAGDQVALLLAAANRDPLVFAHPDRFDLERGADRHLAFGTGTHSCVGASFIRFASVAATRALLGTTSAVELLGDIDWVGGFAIRVPSSLRVVLRRDSDSHPEFPMGTADHVE
jgi:cytochrome P450